MPEGYWRERRGSPRLRANAPGKVIGISCGLRVSYTSKCRVVDMSETGAQIEIASERAPDMFYLELDEQPDAPMRTCQVVWRAGNRVGVKF